MGLQVAAGPGNQLGLGSGPWGWGWASVPLQSPIWDYRARRVVLTAPGWSPGEGELVDLVPSGSIVSGCSPGQVHRDNPQRAPSLLLAAEEVEPKESKVLGSEHWEEPRPSWLPGRLPVHRGGPTAAPGKSCNLLASVSCLAVVSLGQIACGAGTGVLLLARGSWGTWLWLRNVRGLPQTEVGGR